MKNTVLTVICMTASWLYAQPLPRHNLNNPKLPVSWDEALPLGNAMVGALVWHNGTNLRLSLDRADLWDERATIDFSRLRYDWVYRQVLDNNYGIVQQYGDVPYEDIAWPTKIPGAALEFRLSADAVNELDIATATVTIKWKNGTRMRTFVHATGTYGMFEITQAPAGLRPVLIPPAYRTGKKSGNANSVEGQSLERLGYDQGVVTETSDAVTYTQTGSLGFAYQVAVVWKWNKGTLTGVWSIDAGDRDRAKPLAATETCRQALAEGFDAAMTTHTGWWKDYWNRSSIRLPDPVIDRQYHLEMYKLGCVARIGAPAITLQSVWTADNGKLPPWKGDFHHDLNTQLSYWPAYSGNHTDLAQSFTDWLWEVREENRRYTREFFGKNGLNVPGVTTLKGSPMGGWIQYSFSPTVSAWLAQHFYWQWRYTGDEGFLTDRAYPYISDVATFLDEVMVHENGMRKLPIGSSPEYHDNKVTAWFTRWTNYDLSLVINLFQMASVAAEAAGRLDDARRWEKVLAELPPLDRNETGLTIAPGQNLTESHRHIAHLMALHPLGTLNPDDDASRDLISRSLRHLEAQGTDWWTGYSFSWAACLYARAHEGTAAAKQLDIFARNFCLSNSFHANGDQQTGKYSRFRYRPFTLEGNLAFAQGVHEMLLQSHEGFIEIFPAVPDTWSDIAFRDLRTEGAFLVSAQKRHGQFQSAVIKATKSGLLKVRTTGSLTSSVPPMRQEPGNILVFDLKSGDSVVVKAAN